MSNWLDKVGSDEIMTDFAVVSVRLWVAPAMAYIAILNNTLIWSVYDAGSFAQNLMLSATNQELDTVVAYENIKYPNEIRKNLGVSEDKINNFTNSRLTTEKD